MTVRRTRRWYGISAVALLATAIGTVLKRPGLLLVGAVGVTFAAYARSATPPPTALSIERSVSETEPGTDDRVIVTVTITNDGSFLADVRVIDGVPSSLEVIEGSPRHATVLPARSTTRFEYAVRASRGEHRFDPATVLTRDPSGATERESTISTGTTITCTPTLPETTMTMPIHRQARRYGGSVPTDLGGGGIEFYATRQYRPGDALSRIDWGRLAETGDLRTVEFREERHASVVLLLDARPEAYVGSDDPAVEYGIDAAMQVFASLLSDGHRVGIAALGREPCWLAPDTGRDHRVEARRLFGQHPALAPTPPERSVPSQHMDEIRQSLPPDAQVILFTPLVDDEPVVLIGRLWAHGHPVSVVSPDVTGDGTPGEAVARIERRVRIDRLRNQGVPVIDWTVTEDFETYMRTNGETWR